MSEKKPVRFVKPWRSFFKDDVAGFPADVADELVDGGVAEYHNGGSAEGEQPAPRAARSRGKGVDAAKKGAAAAPVATNAEPTAPPAGEGSDNEPPAPGENGADDEEKP